MERTARRTIAVFVAALVVGATWLAWPRTESVAPTSGAESPGPSAAAPRSPTRRARSGPDESTTAPSPVAATPAPVDKDAVIATLDGRVVDAVTGRPIEHAGLQWGYVDPRGFLLLHDLYGETKADGALAFVYARTGWWAPDHPDDVAELWVKAEGYATAKVRAPVSPVEVRLRPLGNAAPGTIRVHALRGDGSPWTGLVVVEAADEFGDEERLCAVADADGRCSMFGVPARICRARLDERVAWTDVAVLPGGVADVELRGPPPTALASLTKDELLRRRESAAKEMEDAKAKGDAARAESAEAAWKAAWDEIGDRTPEQRPLVFENLPADAEPLVEVRVETHDWPYVWRLPVDGRRVALLTRRDGAWWWRVKVLRAGAVESRTITILGERDGSMAASTGQAGGAALTFPLAKDGTLVVDWEKLVPDR